MNPFTKLTTAFAISALSLSAFTSTASAAYVTPQMGGGEFSMMMGAAMIHADVSFDGTSISVMLDTSHGVPKLRPLTSPNEFDPNQPWSVLSGKAYNFQWAWNPSGFITIPRGAGIWVERLHHDDGLEAYLRPPAVPAYAPVFQADGDRWQWSGAMTHNVYTVLNPLSSEYEARYRVYIGDSTTGAPLPGYGSQDVTWNWTADPIPEPTTAAITLLAGAGWLLRRKR